MDATETKPDVTAGAESAAVASVQWTDALIAELTKDNPQ